LSDEEDELFELVWVALLVDEESSHSSALAVPTCARPKAVTRTHSSRAKQHRRGFSMAWKIGDYRKSA
jgi:hypothetical protein